MRQFWYPVPDHFGIGVTSATRAEADGLASDAARQIGWPITLGACQEDVDIRQLDAKHVLPNSGPIVVRGVWFPRSNL